MLRPMYREDASAPVVDAIAGRCALLRELATELLQARRRRLQWLVETQNNVRAMCIELNRVAARVRPNLRLDVPAEVAVDDAGLHVLSKADVPQETRGSEGAVDVDGEGLCVVNDGIPYNGGGAMSAVCPADLTQRLLVNAAAAGDSNHHRAAMVPLTPLELEMAIGNLSPAELRRQPVTLFTMVLPTLLRWIHTPSHAAHAFALMHEGFCVFAGAMLHTLQAKVCASNLVATFLSTPAGHQHAVESGIPLARVDELVRAILAPGQP
jgi:hypothetical protein